MFGNDKKKRVSFGRHVSMILVLAMLFTGMFTGCGTEQKETEAVNPTVETETEVEVISLSEEVAKSDVMKLMKRYFKALKKGDVDALGEIMVNAPSKQTLEREIEYIENYKNIKCYTQPGKLDNTYVAYVYYDVKFKNIDTLAPSMIREYICTNEEGNLYINNGTVDGDVAEWLDTVHNSEAVASLLSDVNKELTDAASKDEKLQALVSQLGAGVEETTAEESSALGESAAESQTNETAESATETEAAESSEAKKTEEETSAKETKAEETTAKETKAEKKENKKPYKEYKKAKVLYTIDITNVRKTASSSSKLLGRLNEGKKVTAVGEKNDWYVIKYGSKKGYIKKDLLTSKKPKTEITFKSKDDKVEALQNVKMRKKPSETAKSLGTLPGGTKVTRTGYSKKWTRIVYNGKTVYVASEYVEKVD